MKTTLIFFSAFQWHDFGFLAKILIFLGFLGKITCQDFVKNSKKSKILARNDKSPRLCQEIQNYPRLSKIFVRKPRRQALGMKIIVAKPLHSHVLTLRIWDNYEQSTSALYGAILFHIKNRIRIRFLGPTGSRNQLHRKVD